MNLSQALQRVAGVGGQPFQMACWRALPLEVLGERLEAGVDGLYRSLMEVYFVSFWAFRSFPAFWALSSSKARVMSGSTGRSSAIR